MGVGYYTKRLLLIVISLIIVSVAIVILWKWRMHTIETTGYYALDPLFDLQQFGIVVGMALFFVNQVIISIVIICQRKKELEVSTFVNLDRFLFPFLGVLINFALLIATLVGTLPVAFPVALINTVRELFGWDSDGSEGVIEHICVIIQAILGFVMLALLFFSPWIYAWLTGTK